MIRLDAMTVDEMRNMVNGAKIIENNARDLLTQAGLFAEKVQCGDTDEALANLYAAVRSLSNARNRLELLANTEIADRTADFRAEMSD